MSAADLAAMRAKIRTAIGPKRCGHDVPAVLMSIDPEAH
jgi:hypothetical protein